MLTEKIPKIDRQSVLGSVHSAGKKLYKNITKSVYGSVSGLR